MRFGTMLGDVTSSLFRKPITQKYPKTRQEAPERLRGRLHWDPEKCTGCGICAMDCPANAIEMIVLDKKEKRFVLHYHVDRCTFCAQCVHSCMHGCLDMSFDIWELAAMDKDDFSILFGDSDDIRVVLEGST